MLDELIFSIYWHAAFLFFFQRFALAVAELNGALYAVGGYDGKEYLE